MSWPTVKLGEVCELRNGYTPKAEALVDEKQVGSVPYFRVAAMNCARDGVWMDKPSAYCVAPKRLFPKGTVVFPKNGGAIYTGKVRILEEESIVDLNTAVATPLEGVTTEYLYYYVRALSLEDYIVPGTLPFVDFQLLRSAPFPLPPLPEQEQIVEDLERKLSRLAKIEGNFRAMAETAAQASRSAITEAFRSLDAPTAKLGEVCGMLTDGDWIESRNQSENGIRLIQVGNIGVGNFRKKDGSRRYISEATFTQLNCTEVLPGDILISRLPEPLGRSCLVPDIGERMITAVDCTIARVISAKLLPQYFVLYSQSAIYQCAVDQFARGTTRRRISRKNLEALSLPLPPLSEQYQIVEELEWKLSHLAKVEQVAREAVAVCAQARRAVLVEAFRHE